MFAAMSIASCTIRASAVCLLSAFTFSQAFAQTPDRDEEPSGAADSWAVAADTRYRIAYDETYTTDSGRELPIDIYSRRDTEEPQPTLIYFHGGFWVFGSKDTQIMALLPWLEMGWNIVNVGYRLGGEAVAPAAVTDSFCALRYVVENAERFNIDPERIVASGQSAGGHLALSLAMLDEEGFDANCPGTETPELAAVINWYGVTDVSDVISGENRSETAALWFDGMDEDESLELAERLSPLNYVREGLPPILTIQGDMDTIVPYTHGESLHQALQESGDQHHLLTVPGGGHGRFSIDERIEIYDTIYNFLEQAGIEGDS